MAQREVTAFNEKVKRGITLMHNEKTIILNKMSVAQQFCHKDNRIVDINYFLKSEREPVYTVDGPIAHANMPSD